MIADGGGFVGKMQHLVVNGNQVFEMLRSGEFHGRSRMRGGGSGTIIGPSPLAPPSALTFRTEDAYLVVNMRIHSTFTIHLQVCFCFELMVDCASVGIFFISPNAKNTDTYIHIQIYKYTNIYVHTQIIYIHTDGYVEAVELHETADILFHSLDKYKPNLTSNFCMRLALITLGRSKPKYS